MSYLLKERSKMRNNFLNFTSIILIALLLQACSKNLDGMSIHEQSIYQPNRYSDDDSRDKNRKPLDILKFSGVKPGDKVIDLLGGGGYYTELFNYIVGDKGKVYIQNNSLFLKFSNEELSKRLKNNRLKNVIRIDSEFADMMLPENVDLMFIGLSYHDIYVERDDPTIMTSREEFFPQIFRAIKPGGKLLIIDHAAKPGTGKTMTKKLHRIDEEWAIKDIESAGFKLLNTLGILRNTDDDHTLDIWKRKIRGKTDRFIHLYEKPIS